MEKHGNIGSSAGWAKKNPRTNLGWRQCKQVSEAQRNCQKMIAMKAAKKGTVTNVALIFMQKPGTRDTIYKYMLKYSFSCV